MKNTIPKLLLLLASLFCLSFATPQATPDTSSKKEQLSTIDAALKDASMNSKSITVKVADYVAALDLVTLLAQEGSFKDGRFTRHEKAFILIDEGAGSEDSRIDYVPIGKEPKTIVLFTTK